MIKTTFSTIAAFAIVVLLAGSFAGADMTVDDFESYAPGQTIGPSAVSNPWRRFGHATNDHVYATNRPGKLITGQLSGQYGAYWPNRFGAVRYVFEQSTDVSVFKKIAIKMRSENAQTYTQVRAAISNGTTTYVTRDFYKLSDDVQDMTFMLGETHMYVSDGSQSYKEVVAQVQTIGFDFTSTEGQYMEAIFFDDFVLVDSDADGANKVSINE